MNKPKVIELPIAERRDVYDYNGEYYAYVESAPGTWTDLIVVSGVICEWNTSRNCYVAKRDELK